MKKLGRPKMKPNERKKLFATRFTDAELKAFKRAAKDAKKTVREWISETLWYYANNR